MQLLRQGVADILAIYAFGSRVTGHAGPESDWDLAVLAAGRVDPLLLWQLSGDLAERVHAPVDLVDMRAASTVMQYQVITTGQRLWAKDHQAALFECHVLSDMTALNEARAPLLAQILREGSIHGR